MPNTYAEAREIGVYRDWYSIFLTSLGWKINHIAINLLEKGVSVENVYETVALPESERKLKNADYWQRICAAVDDKSIKMSECFRSIINERICEITKKLLERRIYLNITTDDIYEVTNLTKEEIEKIRQ